MTIKYTLKYEDDEGGTTREVTHVLSGKHTWTDLLPHIEDWLKGIGYVFDGTLDISEPKDIDLSMEYQLDDAKDLTLGGKKYYPPETY